MGNRVCRPCRPNGSPGSVPTTSSHGSVPATGPAQVEPESAIQTSGVTAAQDLGSDCTLVPATGSPEAQSQSPIQPSGAAAVEVVVIEPAIPTEPGSSIASVKADLNNTLTTPGSEINDVPSRSIEFSIVTAGGVSTPISILQNDPISVLKGRVEDVCEVPRALQQLSLGASVIPDDGTTYACGIQAGSVVTLVVRRGSLQLSSGRSSNAQQSRSSKAQEGHTLIGTPWSHCITSFCVPTGGGGGQSGATEKLTIGGVVFSYTRQQFDYGDYGNESVNAGISGPDGKGLWERNSSDTELVVSMLTQLASSEWMAPDAFADELQSCSSRCPQLIKSIMPVIQAMRGS